MYLGKVIGRVVSTVKELRTHLEQAIRLSALLGLQPEELESRLREASDNATTKEMK